MTAQDQDELEDGTEARQGRSGWTKLAATALVVVSTAALLGFALGRDPSLIKSPLLGHRAPGFALRTLDGKGAIRLSELRGHVVVVNFWASWCIGCIEEHPNLFAAWQRFGDDGVVFLGVLYQDTPANARGFLKQLGAGWPTLLDPGGRTALRYGVYGIPETFFIGRDGRIGYKQIGPSSYELLVQQIERLEIPPKNGAGKSTG